MPPKPDDEKLHNVNVGMKQADIQRLDALAERVGVTRRQMAYNLVLAGMEMMEDLERFKVITLSVYLRDKLNRKDHKKLNKKYLEPWTEEVLSSK